MGHFIRGKGELVSHSGDIASGSGETHRRQLYFPVDDCRSVSSIRSFKDEVQLCRRRSYPTAELPEKEMLGSYGSKCINRSSLPLR